MARRKRRRRYPYQGLRTHEDYLDAVWRGRLADLRVFQRRFGHTRAPRGFAEDRSLGRWVAHQRALHRLGDLRQARAQALRKLGFEFVLPDAPVQVPWEVRYRELRAFQKRFAHTRVPAQWRESPCLARWVRTQRTFYRLGLLSHQRTRTLQALGFEWRLRQSPLPWSEMFERLRAFRRAYGHCDVSERLGGPRLAHWAQRQRQQARRGRLPADRRQKLMRLGFRWRIPGERRPFAERLAQLRRFRRRHGHVSVPQDWPEDPALPVWIGNQRRAYRNGTLSAAHVAELARAGFHFEARARSWNEMLERLTRFRRRYERARLLSAYTTGEGVRFWIITEARSVGDHGAPPGGVLRCARRTPRGLVTPAPAASLPRLCPRSATREEWEAWHTSLTWEEQLHRADLDTSEHEHGEADTAKAHAREERRRARRCDPDPFSYADDRPVGPWPRIDQVDPSALSNTWRMDRACGYTPGGFARRMRQVPHPDLIEE